MRESLTGDPGDVPSEMTCPSCGASAPDWSQVCDNCGHRVRSKEEAARAEQEHIAYLLKQLPWLSRRGLVPDDVAARLRQEYESRSETLNRLAAPPLPPMARAVPPVIPPLPDRALEQERPVSAAPETAWPPVREEAFPADTREETRTMDLPLLPTGAAATPAMADDDEQATVPNRAPAPRARLDPARIPDRFRPAVRNLPPPTRKPPPPARVDRPPFVQANPKDLRIFFQAHGLKLIFALATMLVLYALRSLIAWQAVGAVAIPAVLIGLTFMFYQFGSRTREENPWAAYVFHGMTCILAGFDVGVVNRFWLDPVHLQLPMKPALLLACGAGTGMAGFLLMRFRRVSYLHLFQSGILLTVYCLLQNLRLILWHQNDFHAAPLPLFGVAYLILAGIDFFFAGRSLRQAEATQVGASGSGGTSVDADPQPDTLGSAAEPGLPDLEWNNAWTLWAHLSATAIVALSSLNVLLSEHQPLRDFAAVLLLGGIVYAAGAQVLMRTRAVYTAGAFFTVSALLWLANSYANVWPRFGFLVMGISAAAMALTAYNQRPENRGGAGLAIAWRRVARYSLVAATTLAALQVASPWTGGGAPLMPRGEAVTLAMQTLVSGVLLVLLGRLERRPETTYGVAAAWGATVVGLLEAAHASLGGYAVAFVVYGAVLYFGAVAYRKTVAQVGSQGGPSLPAQPAGIPDDGAPTPWLAPNALARSGQVATAIGALGAAALPTAGLPAHWLLATLALALASALYVVTAHEERSRPAIYAALTCLAYASALLMWRTDPRLSLADLLAPFMIGTGLASVVLAYALQRHSQAAAPAPTATPSAPFAASELWRDPLAVGALTAVLIALVSLGQALMASAPYPHAALSTIPLLAASLLVLAGRRDAGPDMLGSIAAVLANSAGALLGALLCGFSGPAHWNAAAVQRTAAAWLAQGWLVWGCGKLFRRRAELAVWSADLAGNGLRVGLAAAVACTLSTNSSAGLTSVLPIAVVMTGSFLLMIAEAWSTGNAMARALSVVVMAFSAVAFSSSITAGNGFSETAWTLFALMATACYFVLAAKDQSEQTALLTLAPLLLGFGLFLFWKSRVLPGVPVGTSNYGAVQLDISIANHLWAIGGFLSGWLYLQAARRHQRVEAAAISASVIAGACCHVIAYMLRPEGLVGIFLPEAFSILMLPCVGALYLYGTLQTERAPYIGNPFRHVALVVATCVAGLVTLRSAAGLTSAAQAALLPIAAVVTAAFSLMTFETYRTGKDVPRATTLLLVGMVAVCFYGHVRHHGAGPLYPGTLWMLFSICAAWSYFLVSRNVKQPPLATLALWPLSLGCLLFAFWKGGALLTGPDTAIANGLVILGGLGAAIGYFDTAWHSEERAFTYVGAILLTGTCAHTISLFGRIQPEWFALMLLPVPVGQYLAGVYLRGGRAFLGEPLRTVGMATVLASALVVTARAAAGISPAAHISVLPVGIIMAAAFALAAAETYQSRQSLPRVFSFIALVLAGLVFHAYSRSGIGWLASEWTLLMLAACGAYFAIAVKEQDPVHAYAPLFPLVMGYLLYSAWRANGVLAPLDNHVADLLWVAGGAGAAFAYVTTARRSQIQSFAYLAALLLVASYTHMLSILDPHEQHVDRYALLVLPLLAGMYGYGVMRQTDEFAGRPFRRVALALSGVALIFSTLFGDGFLASAGQTIDHSFITLTLAAYGLAYAAIAFYRRTPGTVASASITLSAAYVHGLLTLTPYWAGTTAALSWPRFAFFVVLPGVMWTAIAWLLIERAQKPDHARPLQGVSTALAVLGAAVALTAFSRIDGDWSLGALIGASAIWISLWRQRMPEFCWHIGAWNLLAAWVLAIQLHFGGANDRVDLYVIPFGLYLLLAGHRSGELEQPDLARAAWWCGLIVILTPPFVLYWTHAQGAHHIFVLIAECVGATLWGVVRRIRAYVSAGFAFLVLLTVASWFRHVNDIAGTLSALAIGVALFIWVYYWLTHRERIENWLLRVSGAWRAWRAWR